MHISLLLPRIVCVLNAMVNACQRMPPSGDRWKGPDAS